MISVDATPAEGLLWPGLSGPADLAEVERIPLDDRGLPASTYELVTRAARLWPRPRRGIRDARCRALAGAGAPHVRRARRRRPPRGERATPSSAWSATTLSRPLGQLRRADARCCSRPRRSGSPRRSTRRSPPSTPTELVRLAGARVIVASGPELDPVVWEHARTIARETGARALLALRPTAPEDAPPALEPLGATAVAYLAERMAGADAAALPGPPPRARTTSRATCTPAARPAPRSSPRARTPTRSPTPG